MVTAQHQAALNLDQIAVSESQLTVADAQVTLARDQAEASAAQAAVSTATGQLNDDQTALVLAAATDQTAAAQLAADRARLRGLALGVYTGALTGPEPPSLQTPATEQQAAIDGTEVNVVARVVVHDLGTDITAAATAANRHHHAEATVGTDQRNLATDQTNASAAAGRVPPAAATLATAQKQLATFQQHLTSDQAVLKANLTAVVGAPSPQPAGLSVLGTAALTAQQVAAWFNAQGYADLTSTPVAQLAAWYLQAGAAEGVRGDVAFAQAVLETGGFSSPDAVSLNNYAGIGHCDSCASGFAFPSPYGGVLGHVQLLRIFADAGPAPNGAPAPVLPSLAPAHQFRAGCCSTWESLTGIWASDPSYGEQILLIYQQMLASAVTPNETASTGG